MKRSRKSVDFDAVRKKVVKISEPQTVVAICPSVALSSRDKAAQLMLSDDQLICYGCEGGYRMVRATNGVHSGSYYWEAVVLNEVSSNSHVRIGWSTRQGELQGPVGYDRYSYGYRDVNGATIHKSIRNDNYGESFGSGDVIGCYICLDAVDPDKNEIKFYKNGKDQGVAFRGKDIPSSVYFPAISLYMDAVVCVNFGPSFIVRCDINGANAVSEVSPLNPIERKIHESRIAELRNRFVPGLCQSKVD